MPKKLIFNWSSILIPNFKYWDLCCYEIRLKSEDYEHFTPVAGANFCQTCEILDKDCVEHRDKKFGLSGFSKSVQ